MDIKGKDMPNKSGHPHAESKSPYRTALGIDGCRWFYRTDKFGASHIYVENGNSGIGMGGATVRFHLEDGTHYDCKAPWMGNANQLFDETGVDLREKHGTRLILSRNRKYSENNQYMPDMIDVVYHEPEFVEGTFDRPNELAQSIADKMGERLFYFIETAGGAQSGQVSPKEESC